MTHRRGVLASALAVTMLLATAGSALADPPAAGSPPPGDETQPVFTGPSLIRDTECVPIQP